MQLYLMPFSLSCGHTFCFHCLDNLSQHAKVCDICPCCRKPIGDQYPTRSKTIENLLPYIKDQLSPIDKQNYELRNAKMIEEFSLRASEYRFIGSANKIDLKIGNHWEVGTVLRLY